ncbi:MAG: 30S ribosomal protein S5 [Candidatus Portnoybacteria bacterium RBG_13_41_18]|uniref:Small ribosomal subunit protein uS5 n=1 Tax=Candidatus Portnoybacteria bacterium RBG_13_41_18 TaxID=1801991 RepID=A0A1G2F8L8_9BACT|nr:MAG: 30S ribosomal protein S5 [Candidatus Portnoybacteria bacterium RBG_13_41_18]
MSEPTRKFRRREKEKSEYDQKVLDVARVTRVVAGGRRFRFRTVVAIGNRAGKVGIGVAKAADVTTAVEKSVVDAKKSLVIIPIKEGTIPHEVTAKFGAARVILKPAKRGRGLVSGGAVRIICDLAGIENISAKVVSRSKNKLNNAMATLKALKQLRV